MNHYIKSSSRFSTPEDIKKSTKKINIKNGKTEYAGIPVLKEGNDLYVCDVDAHTFINGDTGSFKTRRYIFPQVLSIILKGESFIVHDCKLEVMRLCHAILDQEGYKTLILNFREPMKSNCYWNPLGSFFKLYREGQKDLARNFVRELGINLFSAAAEKTTDIFWANSASTYFSGLAKLAMQYGTPNDVTIEGIYATHLKGRELIGNQPVLTRFIKENSGMPLDIVADLSPVTQAAKDTRESIYSVFNQYISLYTSQEGLCDLMSKSSFDIRDISNSKVAVFIIAPDESEHLNPLVTAFFTQAYAELIDYADNMCHGVLPSRVNFIMEELAQLPKINSFSQMLSASRSRNIRFTLVVQSTSQLYNTYGRDMAHTIISNCSIWIFLHSQHIEFLHELSIKCGEYTDYAGVSRPLLSISDLQRFDKEKGEALLLLDRNYPFIMRMPDITVYEIEYPILQKLSLKSRMISNDKQEDLGNFIRDIKIIVPDFLR